MELDEAMEGRSSVRRFLPDPVPREHLQELVGLALRAATVGRESPWKVLAITDPALVARMAEAVEGRLDELAAASTRRMHRPEVPDCYAHLAPPGWGRGPDAFQVMRDASLFFRGAPAVLAFSVCSGPGPLRPGPMGGPPGPHGPMGGPPGPVGGPPGPLGGPGSFPGRGGRPGRVPGVRFAARLLARAIWGRLTRQPLRREPVVSLEDHVAEVRPDLQALGAALQNLALAAHARGYGACWMTAPLVARERLEQLLGLDRPWTLAALVPVGRPAEPPQPRPRPALEDVLEFRPG